MPEIKEKTAASFQSVSKNSRDLSDLIVAIGNKTKKDFWEQRLGGEIKYYKMERLGSVPWKRISEKTLNTTTENKKAEFNKLEIEKNSCLLKILKGLVVNEFGFHQKNRQN